MSALLIVCSLFVYASRFSLRFSGPVSHRLTHAARLEAIA
mgnify:CR=1 FL=1